MDMESNLVAYDPTTGAIIGIMVTPPQVMAWQAEGMAVISGPQGASLDTHRVVEGQVVAKTVVSLVPDKSEISADGQDQAVVSVTVDSEEPPASIEVLVAGVSRVVALADGAGHLDPIVTATATTIAIQVADRVAFLDHGGCVITAVVVEEVVDE